MSQYTYISKDRPSFNKPDDDDDDATIIPLLGGKQKPYAQYDLTYSAQHTHYYLSEEIGEPKKYIDMIHRMNTASGADVIFIHLNTIGGQLDTGVQLINAMQNSQAKIVTILESAAHSLGTLLFLSGDEMVVNDNCIMMFHNFSGGFIGKGNEASAQLAATVKWFNALAKKIYIPFLTEDEFNKIIHGEDLWFLTPDIRKRLDNMVKVINNKSDKPTTSRKKKQSTTDESSDSVDL